MACQRLEVLHDGGEVEFVACAGEAAQAHALEAVVGLQVCKAHLDLLALIARFVELGRPVCTENLNPDIVVMKPAKDRV